MKLIESTVGDRVIRNLKGSDFKRWHKLWGILKIEKDGETIEKPAPRRAQGGIKLLRAILSFGASEQYESCSTAREILSLMKFETPKPRMVALTLEHANAIIDEAIKQGYLSIALTQAIQFETALRRIDIIGEWETDTDNLGGIIEGNKRWVGPDRSSIDKNWIFTTVTSKTGVKTKHDLSACELTKKVIDLGALPALGPLIVAEHSGKPYLARQYGRKFREIARAAGVPDEVYSMDSRAGAISEADLATGGDIDKARRFATHNDQKTTKKYIRNDPLDLNREIALRRKNMRGNKE